MTLDWQRARQDTPGCERVLHLNNAGAALMPQLVLDAVVGYLQLEAQMGGYEAAAQQVEAVERVYDAIATLLGCQRHEVALIENATRAWDMGFYSIPLKKGDRILTGVSEYGSNFIAFLQVARKTGATIEVIPNDEFGQISIPHLHQAIDERVKLIAITHVPTNGGLVNPAVEVGKVAKEAGILYLLDACQSVGQLPINVQEIGCDLLSATGRKYLRGPRGTGFLYVREGVIEQLEPPFLDMQAAEWVNRDTFKIRADARRFENWETNYAGKIGLGVAVDYALSWGLAAIEHRIRGLADNLREQLNGIDGVTVQDLGQKKCGIVSFTVKGKEPNEIKRVLSEKKINLSVSSAQGTRLDMDARGFTSVLRASVHYYNTEAEFERFCTTLASFI